jgi:hypothetical protein
LAFKNDLGKRVNDIVINLSESSFEDIMKYTNILESVKTEDRSIIYKEICSKAKNKVSGLSIRRLQEIVVNTRNAMPSFFDDFREKKGGMAGGINGRVIRTANSFS